MIEVLAWGLSWLVSQGVVEGVARAARYQRSRNERAARSILREHGAYDAVPAEPKGSEAVPAEAAP